MISVFIAVGMFFGLATMGLLLRSWKRDLKEGEERLRKAHPFYRDCV